MTAIRELGDCDKHASPSIDEIVLSQVRQKLSERRRQVSTCDKKEVHKCLRNYEDKLAASPNFYNDKHIHHHHHHNREDKYDSGKQTLNSSGRQEVNNSNINVSNQPHELQELEPFLTYAAELSHDLTTSNNKDNNEFMNEPIYLSQSPTQPSREMIKNCKHHRNNHIKKAELLEKKEEESKEQEKEETKPSLTNSGNTNMSKETNSSLVSNGTNNFSAHSFMRLSSRTSLVTTTNSRSTNAQNAMRGRRQSSKTYDHFQKEKLSKQQEELANVLLATAEEHMECEKEQHRRLSGLNSLNKNIHRVKKLSISTNGSTNDHNHASKEKKNSETSIDASLPSTSVNFLSSNSHACPNKMSIMPSSEHINKKLPLNKHFVFPSDLSVNESASIKGTTSSSDKLHESAQHSNNNDINYPARSSRYSRNLLMQSNDSVNIGSDVSSSRGSCRNYVTRMSDTNDNSKQNKISTIPIKTLSPRELSEAFYRNGSGGVMAAAAYAHFLNESKHSNTHNRRRTTTIATEPMKSRNSNCIATDSDKENLRKTSYDTLLWNNINTNNTFSRSNTIADVKHDGSMNQCNDFTESNVNTNNGNDNKLQELLAQSRALYLQKCKPSDVNEMRCARGNENVKETESCK